MKNTHTIITFVASVVAVMVIPGAVFAGGSWKGPAPYVKTQGASLVTNTKAVVQGSYDSADADYNTEDKPNFYFEYGPYGNFMFTTPASKQSRGSRNIQAEITGLQPGTTYHFRAVVDYSYGRVTGDVKYFTTNFSGDTQTATLNGASNTSGSQAGSGTQTSSGTTTPKTTTILGNYTSLLPGSSSKSSSTTETTKTSTKTGTGASVFGFEFPSLNRAGTDEALVVAGVKDGIKLTLTNNTDRTERGQNETYEVIVENTTARDVKHVTVQVALPEGYRFVNSTGDSEYDKAEGIVTIELGTVQANDSETQSIDIKVLSGTDNKVTAYAQATFTDRNVDKEVKAKDTDAVGTGNSVLGASIFGSGFFPQTFVGWFLIALLIWFVIMLARYYQKQSAALKAAQPGQAKA